MVNYANFVRNQTHLMKIKSTIIALAISMAAAFSATASGDLTNSGFLQQAGGVVRQKKAQATNILHVNSSLFAASSSRREWTTDRMNKSGLFINVSLFLPSKKFLNPHYSSGDPRLNPGYDVELGNYFKFARISSLSIGLRATWISLGFTTYHNFEDIGVVSVSLLRAGPQAAFALNEKMGIDLFYQVGANYTIVLDTYGSDLETTSFLGATHEIGAGFRYRVFNAGLGFRLGKLINLDDTRDMSKYSIANLRLILGFKF